MDRFRFFRAMAYGRKYKNGVANGDFAAGIGVWQSSNAGTPSVTNRVLQFTPTAAPGSLTNTQHVYKPIDIVLNHKIYACAHVIGKTTLQLRVTSSTIASVAQDDVEQWISGIVIAGVTGTRAFGLRDTAASGWTQAQCDHIGCVDLTSVFGAGNEPTVEWCDANIRPNIFW